MNEKFKAINRSYNLGLFCPSECLIDMRDKLTSLAKLNPTRFKPMVKGFDLAVAERLRIRQAELQNRRIQSNRSKSQDRGR